jgi:hypothetical protein
MADAAGSIVGIDMGAQIQVTIQNFKPDHAPGFWLKLEREYDSVVRTQIWHDITKPPATLRHVPGYGVSHRLVIDARTLDWDQDCVFRQRDILVRFVTGGLEGESKGSLKAVNHGDGKLALQGEQTTATASGRFIEVVSPGASADQAEALAYAILRIGSSRVFSEPWNATASEQIGQAFIPGSELPRKAAGTELGGLDDRIAVKAGLAAAATSRPRVRILFGAVLLLIMAR